MSSEDSDTLFCSSSFWDPEISWYTSDPDFSLCFEKTALVWVPCLLVWVLSPIEMYFILSSKCRDVPWSFLNISKLFLNVVLLGLSVASLVWSVVQYYSGTVKVYPVDIWSPALPTATYVLSAVLLLWNKVRGLQTSGVLFLFWFAQTIAGIPQMRTEIRLKQQGSSEESTFNAIVYMIHYPIVVLMLILNLFPDKVPRETNYPKSKKICPETQASFASRLVFRWFDPLVWKGYRNPLTLGDLWKLRYQDTSSQIVPMFEKQWAKTVGDAADPTPDQNGYSKSYGTMKNSRNRAQKPVSIIGPIFKTFWKLFLAGGILRIIGDLCAFINPQILSLLIKFVASDDYMWKGIMYAVAMFVASESQTFFYHHNLMTMSVLGLNIRTALISTIYRKSLRVSNSARKESTVGEIVNLMAVDCQRFIDFSAYFNLLFASPIIIGLALYFLWRELGPSSLAGLGVMIILVPINIVIANKVKQYNMRQMKYKDERVKLMNEILSGVKVLKLYAWEPSFKEQILRIREKEMALLRKAALLNASTSFVWTCSSFLVSFATFAVYVLSDEKHVLTPEIAFVATSLFNIIKTPVTMFPMAVQVAVQTIVSTKRINKFMNAEELDLDGVAHDESKKEPLIIENGTFSWGTEEGDAAVLRNINLKVKTGQLVAVVGAVGAGKSSLISAFLGEMDKISGHVNTKGSLSYVPQQAWIQNATVKDNILFGSSYDSKRYLKTITACALQPDFEMLPGGDSTEIGEKGINLSGGQKQRVSLARAVYSNADTYLMDDPLSAVDSHVGKHIFENVIGPTGVLNKKTRVLVTHGVTFLPKVDVIVVLKGGEISEVGTFKELLAKKGEFSEFLVQHITDTEDTDLEPDIEELMKENPELNIQVRSRLSSSGGSVRSTSSHNSRRRESLNSLGGRSVGGGSVKSAAGEGDQLIQTETAETGSVKLAVYGSYLRSIGIFLSIGVVVCQVLFQSFTIGANLWLSDWTEDSSVSVDGVQVINRRNFYLGVYGAFGGGQLLATWMGSFALAIGSIMASRGLHIAMLTRILRAPMSFFDTTPVGRIVNRFGKDIDILDNTLPGNLSSAMNCFFLVAGTLVVITYSTPIFAAVIIPVGLMYILVQRFYINTSRQLKRIESVTRSPIYSHFSETVTGASSIRAYHVGDRFVKTSEDKVDINQMCLYPSMVSNRWLGIRLETVGNLLIFFAALFSVLGRSTLDAGIVGLSVSYALQITSMLNYAVRMSSEIETNIVSVERIQEYADVPQEAAWEVVPRPRPEWPAKGFVSFQNYQVRYREGLDLVLKGINFTVNGGEKIGIVGRTGAGKSSLTLCLFRILEAAGGCILVDDVDIAKIGLGDLRSKLTIIPQDPVLFSGTLRMNLDPFEAYSDSDIWRALQLAHLSEFARSLAAGLHHIITEGGDNLSVGQRQLICLARALLRKTQVLILDEATAAIDLETDDLIQQTIRREFNDCTVLTIAHRLNTIMDSDRVVVLEMGMIKEFDSPPNLLRNEMSSFYSMAKDAGLV